MRHERENEPGEPSAADLDPTRRKGLTLAELLVVLVILGILLSISINRIGAAADRAAVQSAVADAATIFQSARTAAIYRRSPVAVLIDTLRGTLTSRADAEPLVQRDLWQSYRVRLSATRDSMAFDARGLGMGAANLSLMARRGRYVDTLFISRLGRLRH